MVAMTGKVFLSSEYPITLIPIRWLPTPSSEKPVSDLVPVRDILCLHKGFLSDFSSSNWNISKLFLALTQPKKKKSMIVLYFMLPSKLQYMLRYCGRTM